MPPGRLLPHKGPICYGSGCGSVGSTIGSNTRGPRFESSRRQNVLVLSVGKDENYKRGRE